MTFYRIARAKYSTPAAAFSGDGARVVAGRWNVASPNIRAVYAADSLALACLETLVHIVPTPRRFPPSVFYTVEIPAASLERPTTLPAGWNAAQAGPASQDFGTEFLRANRAVGLLIPTVLVPEGLNVLINPAHAAFRFDWVKGPFLFDYDPRLT